MSGVTNQIVQPLKIRNHRPPPPRRNEWEWEGDAMNQYNQRKILAVDASTLKEITVKGRPVFLEAKVGDKVLVEQLCEEPPAGVPYNLYRHYSVIAEIADIGFNPDNCDAGHRPPAHFVLNYDGPKHFPNGTFNDEVPPEWCKILI
jgi:hypothetical protein